MYRSGDPERDRRYAKALRNRFDLPRHFLSVSAISFMLVTGVHILAPILPLYADQFGISNLEIGMVVGGYAAGRLLFDIAGGILSDRFGVRVTAASGCAITCVASFVGGWTTVFEVLLAARVGQGIGSALYVTATMGLIIALAPEASMGRIIALYQGIFMVGLAVGPMVGGVLAAIFGLGAPFYAYGGMALVCTVFSALYLPVHAPKVGPRATRVPRPAFRVRAELVMALLRKRAMFLALVATLLVFITRSGVRSTLLPLFAEEQFGFGEVSVGTLLTLAAVGNVVVLGHAGRAMDRSGRRIVTRWSAVATAVSILAFAGLFQPWTLFPAALILGAATGYAGVVPPVIVADLADSRIRGTAVGIQRMVTDLGLMTGPLIVGAFADGFGLRRGFLLTGALCLVLAAAAFTIPETLGASRASGDTDEQDGHD